MGGEKMSLAVTWRRETRTGKYLKRGRCALAGDRVFFLGDSGFCAYYSRRNKKWTKTKGCPGSLLDSSATLVDDRIILLGGEPTIPYITDAMEFDIPSEEFEVVQTKASPPLRQNHSAAFAEWRREIVVFGGFIGDDYLEKTNKSYSFNVDNKVWTECSQKGQVPIARSEHTATIMRRRMYVYGGVTIEGFFESFYAVRELYIADLSLSYCLTWSTPRVGAESPSIGSYRYPSLNALNGRLLVIGGNVLDTERAIFAFHPTKLEWTCARVVKVAKKHIPAAGKAVLFAVLVHNGILCFAEKGVFEAEISEEVHG